MCGAEIKDIYLMQRLQITTQESRLQDQFFNCAITIIIMKTRTII